MRLFTEHKIRKTECLNGPWLFSLDPDDIGKKNGWQNKLPTEQIAFVPSVWNNSFGMLEYEGAAWYQKEFISEGGTLRFKFEGVMTLADVWLDGIHLGSHYGGFCEFSFVVNNVAKGSHTLTVRADNRFDEHSIPQTKVDWYHYGGITRDVTVEVLDGICILNNKSDYKLTDNTAECNFTLLLYNAAECDSVSDLKIFIKDKIVYSKNIKIEANKYLELKTDSIILENIEKWDMDNPVLYTVEAKTDTDDLIDKIGFRNIEVKDGKILLNSESIEIRGVNHHEEHADWGFAVPANLLKRDLDIIMDLGCNSVRGSHYPNSKYFVDMCDANGILFWSEIPIWGGGFSEEALADNLVVERGLMMHKEMVNCYYNHPSIIIWGMHNEIKTDTKPALEMSKLYYEYLKENGGNRIVTYASDKPFIDICFEYCDIIALNQYHGWYGGEVDEWESFLNCFDKKRTELGFEDKPVIISEFGAAAIYGHHTFDNIKWTEEYQENLMDHCLKLFHRHNMVSGSYIWQFSNIRACKQMGTDRARGFNNKGILDEYRRPKMAYRAVKNNFNSFKTEEN